MRAAIRQDSYRKTATRFRPNRSSVFEVKMGIAAILLQTPNKAGIANGDTQN